MDAEEACPVCHGSGDDLYGCGCQCRTDEEEAVCTSRGCCSNCECHGCGGSCCYCGGTGKKKDWQAGGPYDWDYAPADEKD